MGCNCGKSSSVADLLSKPHQIKTTAVKTPSRISCPKCRTYTVPRSNTVVRCPICQTVFATNS